MLVEALFLDHSVGHLPRLVVLPYVQCYDYRGGPDWKEVKLGACHFLLGVHFLLEFPCPSYSRSVLKEYDVS